MSDLPVLYTKNPCVQCNAVKMWLNKNGLVEGEHYRVEPITEDNVDMLFELGHMAAPVMVFPDGEDFSGFRPDKLAEKFAA